MRGRCSRELHSGDRHRSLPWVLLWFGFARHKRVVLAALQTTRARPMGVEFVSLNGAQIGLAFDHL